MKPEKESKVFTELRRLRDERLAEEKRVGSDTYWAQAHRRGREIARKHGLKYVESPSSAYVLHDQPAKKRLRQAQSKPLKPRKRPFLPTPHPEWLPESRAGFSPRSTRNAIQKTPRTPELVPESFIQTPGNTRTEHSGYQ